MIKKFQTTVYLILWKSDDILEMMKVIDRAFNTFKENENEEVQQILTKRSNYMRKFFQGSVYFHWIFSFICTLVPLTEKELVLPVYFPGFDESSYQFNTRYYWLVYACQVVLLSSIMNALLFYLCLVVNCIYFGTTMTQILKYKISCLGVIGKDLDEEILICIKIHLQIKDYIGRLNNLIENIVFIEMMISAINLSFIIFVFGFAESTIQIMMYIIVVVYNFFAIFIFCFYGDRLTNEVITSFSPFFK